MRWRIRSSSLASRVLRAGDPDAVAVARAVLGAGEGRQLAAVDPVRVAHDPALGRLAEDLGQPDHRHGTRADHVGQHLARRRSRAAGRRRRPAAAPPSAGRASSSAAISSVSIIEASSTITSSASSGRPRLRRKPRSGSASSRRCSVRASRPVLSASRRAARPVGAASATRSPSLGDGRQDAAHQRGLAGARAAGDHQHPAADRELDGVALGRGQRHAQRRLAARQCRLGVGRLPGRRPFAQRRQPVGDRRARPGRARPA